MENVWVFVMAGQSNMAGRARVAPEDTIPNPRILSLDLEHNWVMAKAPLHKYQPNLMGLDCGVSFATELLKHVPDSIHIALVPTAIGGTSIEQWLKDTSKKDISLLTNLKQKTEYAQKYGVLKAVLWHQGEADAKSKTTSQYQERFLKFIDALRTHFKKPNLPIIIGELGKNRYDKNNQAERKKINAILKSVAAQDDFLKLVPLKYTTTFDGYHFDAPSVRKMGRSYAKAYKRLTHKDKF